MAATRIVIPYAPRKVFLPFHERSERWSIIVAHRRAGKTVACVNDLLRAALTCKNERPRFAYIAPLYKQAKTVAWDYLKHFSRPIPGVEHRESELAVNLPNGGQVRLWGSDNPDALRGLYLDGVVLDEAADMSPRLFPEVLRPALSDRQGWCTWIGTPKGHNAFYELWEQTEDDAEWLRLMLKASETGLIDPHELKSARQQMTREQYDQEYECSFQAAIVGSYYGRELDEALNQGRIGDYPHDPHVEVHTSWDLGVSGHTAVWFVQAVGGTYRVVDFFASSDDGLEHVVQALKGKPYSYGRHYLPHDVDVRDIGSGRTRRETLEGLGLSNVLTVPNKPGALADGINAVRRVLPRCFFHKSAVDEGLKALRQYRRDWDDERKVFMDRPVHDWASHPADAFRMFAVGHVDATPKARYRPVRPEVKWVV